MILLKPTDREFKGGQEDSIRAVIHCLQHGSVKGTGTARGVLLADEQGTGKTPCTIVTANTLGYQRILVVCPAALRQNWDIEIRRWQTLNHPVYHLRAENCGVYSPTFLRDLSCGWVIINYDILYKYPGIKDAAWDLVVCDEAIALKSHRARRTTAVLGGVYNRKRIQPLIANKYLFLSGTPIPNRIEEITTLVEALDPDNWSFKQLFKEHYDERGRQVDENRRVTGTPRNLHILQNKLRQSVMVRSLKDEVLDLPPKTYEDRLIELPSLTMEIEFETKHLARKILLGKLRKRGLSKAARQDLRLKLNEIQELMIHMSGACSFKIEAILQDLLQCKEKVVLFAYHHGVIQEYAERLRQAGRKVVVLTGDNTKQTQQIVQRFQSDPEVQFFIGNMKVAGQGITLTAASLAVFAELDWSPGVMEQCEDRLHRIGQNKPVKVMRYLLEYSLDAVVAGALARKAHNSRIALNPQLRLVAGKSDENIETKIPSR